MRGTLTNLTSNVLVEFFDSSKKLEGQRSKLFCAPYVEGATVAEGDKGNFKAF